MSNKLHHKSKRYEVQTFSETSLTWKPVSHTDNPKAALDQVKSITVKGSIARVRDRKCGMIVIEAKPKKHAQK